VSQAGWRSWASGHRVDLLLFGFSLFAYALSSGSLLARQSQAPHFVWQADAFLHGQLHLTARPPNLNDWVFEHGRWYVSFPPFPAVLMMPFVALQGLSFNDVAFTLPFAAVNVALLYRLLRRIQAGRPEWEHAAFALLFGFGTLAWSCGIRGEVWFTAETMGVTLTLLYLHAALQAKHPVLAGLATQHRPATLRGGCAGEGRLFIPGAGAHPEAGGGRNDMGHRFGHHRDTAFETGGPDQGRGWPGRLGAAATPAWVTARATVPAGPPATRSGGSSSRTQLAELRLHLGFGAFDLDDQHGFDIERVSGVREILADADCRCIQCCCPQSCSRRAKSRSPPCGRQRCSRPLP